MIFANRISSSTSCSICLPETSPPVPLGASSVTVFKVAALPLQIFSGWLLSAILIAGVSGPMRSARALEEVTPGRAAEDQTLGLEPRARLEK
jgi:hypothetical protein